MRTRAVVRTVALGLACAALVAPGSTARSASSVVLGAAVGPFQCGGDVGTNTVLPETLGPSAPSYVAAFDGVVSSMSYSAASVMAGTQVRALFVRPSGDGSYVVQEKGPQFPMVPGTVTAYPMRLAVHSGDYLALNISGPGAIGNNPCSYSNAGSTHVQSVTSPDSSSTLLPGLKGQAGLPDISVVLEPDADGDGFGDTSQDQCPASALDHGPCLDHAAPDTTVSKSPPKKTSKHRVAVAFTSPDPTATFQCALDSTTKFRSCSSPFKVKGGAGKHTLLVRAVDPAGNADATPAKVRWKVLPQPSHRRP